MLNIYDKGHFVKKLLSVNTHTRTHTHTQPHALTGALNWSVKTMMESTTQMKLTEHGEVLSRHLFSISAV